MLSILLKHPLPLPFSLPPSLCLDHFSQAGKKPLARDPLWSHTPSTQSWTANQKQFTCPQISYSGAWVCSLVASQLLPTPHLADRKVPLSCLSANWKVWRSHIQKIWHKAHVFSPPPTHPWTAECCWSAGQECGTGCRASWRSSTCSFSPSLIWQE